MNKGRGIGRKNITEKVKLTILYVKALHNGNKYSGQQVRLYILEHLNNFNLKKTDIPQKRSIERIIAQNPSIIEEMKDRINTSNVKGLDNRWSIGICSNAEYSQYFQPESLPRLIYYKNTYQPDLTIREAIWIIKLEPLIKITFSNDEYDLELLTLGLAMHYSESQRISFIMRDEYLDTSELDKKIYIQKDYKDIVKTIIKETLNNLRREYGEKKDER